ncbi:sel1 repeat family protein [Sulfitobacter sp. NFXS29]|uniref:hypothetical protein n=1 Tax=Sulfitobacter sp. NFXS29 TaxID=2818438 RepID=UPI0032DF06AE
MPLFSRFGSKEDPAEQAYQQGLRHLKRGDLPKASLKFSQAMSSGHKSATYNLSLLWGAGAVSPYDFNIAADCWYKAAAAGHDKAIETLWLLEAADRAGFGFDNLVDQIRQQPATPIRKGLPKSLNGPLMICTARFVEACCRKYGATADVIAYELDGAASSDFPFVQAYIARTGLDKSFYEDGLNRIVKNSAADQITDGMNAISEALRESGVPLQLAVMARCSIVGHIISKSAFGGKAQPLQGVDKFFDVDQPVQNDTHPMLQRLCDLLANERCRQYFAASCYSEFVQVPIDLISDVQEATALAQEISDLVGITVDQLYEAIEKQRLT